MVRRLAVLASPASEKRARSTAGQLLCAPYEFPTYRFHSTRAYTNKPACGPKRGHGSVQPRFAMEIQLDKAAVDHGINGIAYPADGIVAYAGASGLIPEYYEYCCSLTWAHT